LKIVAEISASHNESLDKALKLIDAAKKAGADAVKFQTFDPELIAVSGYVIKQGPWKGYELQDLYRKAHTPKEWHRDLFDYAEEQGITAFSTPFHQSDVSFLETIDCPIYKISSFDIINIPLIEYVCSTGKPVIMSTGMATLDEITAAVTASNECQDLTLLHCISSYPADEFYIDTMTDMQEYFVCKVGISDHTKSNIAAIAATALGADVIEKHICLDHEGLDGGFALLPDEFKSMCDAVRATEAIKGVKYGPKPSEVDSYMLRPSLHYSKDLPHRSIIEEHHLSLSRPNDGAPPFYSHQIIGQKLTKSVKKGENVNLNDLLDEANPIRITKINWDTIFKDLEKVGQVAYKIKNQLGVAWSTLDYWKTPGYEPKESIARALLEIHTRHCGIELTQRRIKEAE